MRAGEYSRPTYTDTAQFALDTILQKQTRGVPTCALHVMEHAHIERIAGRRPGDYVKEPEQTYLAMQHALGACILDQYLWNNPLSMGQRGYEGTPMTATTGEDVILLDGMRIDSPEACVEHLERFVFPALQAAARSFDIETRAGEIVASEQAVQDRIGPAILKTGHGFVSFPALYYGVYGYVNYFSAYALYPEVMEKHFSLQADLALRNNQAAARAYAEGNLPPLHRLDHDMADSRGTLVSIGSLDKLWFSHFARSLEPMLKTDVKLIWHCDGNLMQMLPRLLECGIKGFQGFQYEDGMDYEKICRMKTAEGGDPVIVAGVSVTRTLPLGTPSDVRQELVWLVEHAPPTGLFLGASSSITPGVPWENLEALVEGLRHYRTHGRA